MIDFMPHIVGMGLVQYKVSIKIAHSIPGAAVIAGVGMRAMNDPGIMQGIVTLAQLEPNNVVFINGLADLLVEDPVIGTHFHIF